MSGGTKRGREINAERKRLNSKINRSHFERLTINQYQLPSLAEFLQQDNSTFLLSLPLLPILLPLLLRFRFRIGGFVDNDHIIITIPHRDSFAFAEIGGRVERGIVREIRREIGRGDEFCGEGGLVADYVDMG